MQFITLRGKCPMQNISYSVSAKLFDESNKQIGRVDCDYMRTGNCNYQKCPIVEQNGYHQ